MVTLKFHKLTFPTFKERLELSDEIARTINPTVKMIGFVPYPNQSSPLGETWIVTKGALWEIFFNKADPSQIDLFRLSAKFDEAREEEQAVAKWLCIKLDAEIVL